MRQKSPKNKKNVLSKTTSSDGEWSKYFALLQMICIENKSAIKTKQAIDRSNSTEFKSWVSNICLDKDTLPKKKRDLIENLVSKGFFCWENYLTEQSMKNNQHLKRKLEPESSSTNPPVKKLSRAMMTKKMMLEYDENWWKHVDLITVYHSEKNDYNIPFNYVIKENDKSYYLGKWIRKEKELLQFYLENSQYADRYNVLTEMIVNGLPLDDVDEDENSDEDEDGIENESHVGKHSNQDRQTISDDDNEDIRSENDDLIFNTDNFQNSSVEQEKHKEKYSLNEDPNNVEKNQRNNSSSSKDLIITECDYTESSDVEISFTKPNKAITENSLQSSINNQSNHLPDDEFKQKSLESDFSIKSFQGSLIIFKIYSMILIILYLESIALQFVAFAEASRDDVGIHFGYIETDAALKRLYPGIILVHSLLAQQSDLNLDSAFIKNENLIPIQEKQIVCNDITMIQGSVILHINWLAT